MRMLNALEQSAVSAAELVMMIPVDVEGINNTPFTTGFFDGANYAIYYAGLALGFICTPAVVGYRIGTYIRNTI